MADIKLTKFQNILAELDPAKKQALYKKMKSLDEDARNEMIDKVIAAYETRKMTIEQPVPAGIILPPNNYRRTYEKDDRFSERKTMLVGERKNTGNKQTASIRHNRPIKAVGTNNSGTGVVAVRRPSSMPPMPRKAMAVPSQAKPVTRQAVPAAARRMQAKQTVVMSEAEIRAHKKELIQKAGRIVLLTVSRALIVAACTLAILLCGFYAFLGIVMKGASPHLRDQFVTSVMESSVGGVMAQLVLSDDEIQAILNRNKTQEFDTITDASLVKIADKTKAAAAAAATASSADPDGDGIEVHEVSGAMYRGVMMVVYDPSRVKVSSLEQFNHYGAGYTLKQHIEKSGAVAGINGGKYEDKAGMGVGGWPEGIVVSNGKVLAGEPGEMVDVYGFNKNNVLVVGKMTPEYAKSAGIRDAVSFGPTLIVNGKAAKYSGSSGGLNPRTAIGQRADGAVLLLVIEGRKTSSMGATMADLIEIMQEYGAVNATNLDGGMSSAMWYNGEELVSSSSIRQARKMPTAFVVMPKTADDNGQASAKES